MASPMARIGASTASSTNASEVDQPALTAMEGCTRPGSRRTVETQAAIADQSRLPNWPFLLPFAHTARAIVGQAQSGRPCGPQNRIADIWAFRLLPIGRLNLPVDAWICEPNQSHSVPSPLSPHIPSCPRLPPRTKASSMLIHWYRNDLRDGDLCEARYAS